MDESRCATHHPGITAELLAQSDASIRHMSDIFPFGLLSQRRPPLLECRWFTAHLPASCCNLLRLLSEGAGSLSVSLLHAWNIEYSSSSSSPSSRPPLVPLTKCGTIAEHLEGLHASQFIRAAGITVNSPKLAWWQHVFNPTDSHCYLLTIQPFRFLVSSSCYIWISLCETCNDCAGNPSFTSVSSSAGWLYWLKFWSLYPKVHFNEKTTFLWEISTFNSNDQSVPPRAWEKEKKKTLIQQVNNISAGKWNICHFN